MNVAQPFYRFVDEDGRVHIVDRLERVPDRYRDAAEPYDAQGGALVVLPTAPPQTRVVREGAPVASSQDAFAGLVRALDAPSVAVGIGLALGILTGFLVLRRMGAPLLRGVFILAVFATLAFGYLGWSRWATGLGTSHLATPQQVVEDAKAAAERLKARWQDQQEILQELEEAP